ncbi:MAG: polysaccharide deacetylase family protein [Anaerolineae bacterium]|nr:polysaccharide deacetylase family protein [Anaerolineae bacterium]
MTLYIAAYDVESPACLAACHKIVQVHRQHEMPATFFVTGRCLEANPKEYRALLDDPLFEVASHTHAHRTLRDHEICGPAAGEEEVREDIFLGKEWVERVFERPCLGLRPACGFPHGLTGAPQLLALVCEAGYRYVSSALWGPLCSLPAPLTPPFAYQADGFADLWELPGHGWHENLLKGHNNLGALRLLLFPPVVPEAVPDGYVRTPEEEFAYNNRPFIDRALAGNLPHVSLIWHPWSLDRFDPEMRMLEITFRYVREQGLVLGTFAALAAQCRRGAR